MYIAFFFHREAQYGTLWGTICEMREIITDDFKNPGQIRDKNATCEIKNTRFEIKKNVKKLVTLLCILFHSSFMHRRPDLCGSSLDFEFIRQQLRQCIKINKIRPKFHFLTKIEIKVTYLIILFFLCFFYCLFASRAIGKPLYRRLGF